MTPLPKSEISGNEVSAPVENARLATLRSGDRGWILLRPNRSLTRTGVLLAGGLCGIALVPAMVMAILFGAWPVLPFLGFELVVLVLAFRWLLRHYDDQERIVLDPDRILHVRVDGHERAAQAFSRYWARLVVEPARDRARSHRLYLRSHGINTELGRDGSDATRVALLNTLTRSFGIARTR